MPRPRLRPLRPVLRLAAACLVLAAVSWTLSDAPVVAQAPLKQIDLTEKQVQGFIAAQKPMTDAADKMQGDTSDPKLQAALEAVARQQGFKDLAEYDEVAATISMVMAGIDPETRKFTQADDAIRQQIKDLQADKTVPADEKKQAIEELNEALKQAQPIRNPANIELVRKYYDKIEAVLE
jgi:hypothetical protein